MSVKIYFDKTSIKMRKKIPKSDSNVKCKVVTPLNSLNGWDFFLFAGSL